MTRAIWIVLWIGAACGDTIGGQQPVGGRVDTPAEIQRFLRRAYLDLSGKPPSEADLAAATARLESEANTVTARRALIGDLIAAPAFAQTWTEELENAIFGGNDLTAQYQLLCGLARGDDPDCMSCTDPDPCVCSCAPVSAYRSERDQLAGVASEFAAGSASSALERRYASMAGYYVLTGAPDSRVRTLFDDFLQRPAEPDEIENGRAMIVGSLLQGSPSGLMFHRHGATYGDLIDIVFGSEVYREAIVRRVFTRYLARAARPVEIAHFLTTLDAVDPDLRGVIREVVASREYFEQ